jgi:hypothetical protein
MPEHIYNAFYFHFVVMTWVISTCSYARLLGPCFKTGRSQSLYIVYTSTAVTLINESGHKLLHNPLSKRGGYRLPFVPHHLTSVLVREAITISHQIHLTLFRGLHPEVIGRAWILTISSSISPTYQ